MICTCLPWLLFSGNPDVPIIYTVARVRTGRSFTTRRVAASQSGQVICTAIISFHIPEPGWEHQEQVSMV